MKVLWITNIAIPKIAEAIGIEKVPVGGWMVKLADEISKKSELTIVFPCQEQVRGKIGDITYYGFNLKKGDEKKVDYGICGNRFDKIFRQVNPDVIHIHGTEYVHSFIATEICKKIGIENRVVISIQGLISVYERHYEAYLENKIVARKTIRDIYAGNVRRCKKRFKDSGKYEIRAIKNVKHILGRTDWDQACIYFINPAARYHVGNEMLRDSFYINEWDYDNCEKHSIFMSQATSPIKGLHLALEAFSLIKNEFLDAKLYIAGKSYYDKPSWKLSYYEKFIIEYIEKNDLRENVEFTGFLDENEMCERYLKSNVFVSASSIENSPNSVCEAMALGMPVISSMVGGVSNLIQHEEEGFYYQADAPYMLAFYIKKVFDDQTLALEIGRNAKRVATIRHDIEAIIDELIGTYEEIKSQM